LAKLGVEGHEEIGESSSLETDIRMSRLLHKPISYLLD